MCQTGVEDVMTDCKSHKVVVKGDKADPLKVLERVQRKSHRQVELLSPIPNPAEEEKKPEPEEEKKKEEVLNLVSHFNFSFESVECCFNFPFFFSLLVISISNITPCAAASDCCHGCSQSSHALRGVCTGDEKTHTENERCVIISPLLFFRKLP